MTLPNMATSVCTCHFGLLFTILSATEYQTSHYGSMRSLDQQLGSNPLSVLSLSHDHMGLLHPGPAYLSNKIASARVNAETLLIIRAYG